MHFVGWTAAGHPKGRSEAEEPRSGLTRRRPSDTPAPCPPSGNDRSVREIRAPVTRNNPGNPSSINPGNNNGLEERLLDLHRRVQSGAYRAPPVRRVEIPKPDGGTRPLGVAALEDKIVQKAVTEIILTPIYEPVFLGFSYGFRPGRGAHDALDALAVAINRRKVNWVVDCDIQRFFDTVSRDWLVRFLKHRIGDRRVIRLIVKWLKAGVMVDGRWQDTSQGTPQGAIVSPLLSERSDNSGYGNLMILGT